MKRSIVIGSIFTSLLVSSIALVYAFEGEILTPVDGTSYELGTPVEVSFETVIGNAYLGYVCPASVEVVGLSGSALISHFDANGCQKVYDNTAIDTTTIASFSYALGNIQTAGDYKFHVVPNNGCILNEI